MRTPVRIALLQLRLHDTLEANLELALKTMRTAASAGAQLVCFPEIQLSPFFPQFPGRDASPWEVTLDHAAVVALRDACRELEIVAFPNVYLRRSDRTYDATIAIGRNGDVLGVSEMVHVVQAPGFYEQDYYTPSETGFRVYDVGVCKVGVVICFDRHFPESIRTCVLRGADLVVIPTANVKGEDLDLFEWELRVPGAQNGVYIAMCNRVGREEGMVFAGESIVVGPAGDVLAKAGDAEQILYADLDLERIRVDRRSTPYLSLRRPEVYEW